MSSAGVPGRLSAPRSLSVLQVIPTLSRRDGGPAEVVRQLHAHLPSLGVVSKVLTTDRALDADMVPDPSIHWAKAMPPARLNLSSDIHRQLGKLGATCDIIHIHAVDAYTSTLAARFAVRHNIPFIVQPHGAYDAYHRNQRAMSKRVWLYLFDKRPFARASEFVVSSHRERLGVGDVIGAQACTIELGVDDALFQVDASEARSPNLVFLGRVTEKKGVDVAIRAFAASGLASKGVRLRVAGPQDARYPIDPKVLARDLGIAGNVDVLGEVDSVGRARLLSESGIFVLPSKDESFGISVAEAMAAGCSVITTSDVGIAEHAASKQALLISPRTVEAFAYNIILLSRSDALRRSLARQGRQYAQEHYRWPLIVSEFASLYHQNAKK